MTTTNNNQMCESVIITHLGVNNIMSMLGGQKINSWGVFGQKNTSISEIHFKISGVTEKMFLKDIYG